VTPHKRPIRGFLSQKELQENWLLSQNRVVIENCVGRLMAKFCILVRRWAFGSPCIRKCSRSAARWPTLT
jgi:hypothetical protein